MNLHRMFVLAGIIFVTGCTSVFEPKRSAYVVIQPSPGASTSPLLTGLSEKEVEELLLRHAFRRSSNKDAAWLAYIEQRPSRENPQANVYVLTAIARNPKGRQSIEEYPESSLNALQQHDALSLLSQNQKAAENSPPDR